MPIHCAYKNIVSIYLALNPWSCRYPSYCGSNIWPDGALPELEVGKSIIDYIVFLWANCGAKSCFIYGSCLSCYFFPTFCITYYQMHKCKFWGVFGLSSLHATVPFKVVIYQVNETRAIMLMMFVVNYYNHVFSVIFPGILYRILLDAQM